jgi:hypothetical protein
MDHLPESLREAWADYITIADYEAHMARSGQIRTNAGILADLFRLYPPPPGARVLFAGAGTGMYFDFWPAASLAPYRCTFADINPVFLERLKQRIGTAIDAECVLDDLESTSLPQGFDLATVVLTLEHVNWRKAVDGLARIARRVFIVIQENPPDWVAQPLPGTLAALETHRFELVDRAELTSRFASCDFHLGWTEVREVPGRKKMVGLEFVLDAPGIG